MFVKLLPSTLDDIVLLVTYKVVIDNSRPALRPWPTLDIFWYGYILG